MCLDYVFVFYRRFRFKIVPIFRPLVVIAFFCFDEYLTWQATTAMQQRNKDAYLLDNDPSRGNAIIDDFCHHSIEEVIQYCVKIQRAVNFYHFSHKSSQSIRSETLVQPINVILREWLVYHTKFLFEQKFKKIMSTVETHFGKNKQTLVFRKYRIRDRKTRTETLPAIKSKKMPQLFTPTAFNLYLCKCQQFGGMKMDVETLQMKVCVRALQDSPSCSWKIAAGRRSMPDALFNLRPFVLHEYIFKIVYFT